MVVVVRSRGGRHRVWICRDRHIGCRDRLSGGIARVAVVDCEKMVCEAGRAPRKAAIGRSNARLNDATDCSSLSPNQSVLGTFLPYPFSGDSHEIPCFCYARHQFVGFDYPIGLRNYRGRAGRRRGGGFAGRGNRRRAGAQHSATGHLWVRYCGDGPDDPPRRRFLRLCQRHLGQEHGNSGGQVELRDVYRARRPVERSRARDPQRDEGRSRQQGRPRLFELSRYHDGRGEGPCPDPAMAW